MGAFKQLNQGDVTITPFYINRSIVCNDTTSISSSGITVYSCSDNSVYNSVKHLYYSNYLTNSYGDNALQLDYVYGALPEYDKLTGQVEAPINENYLQTSLTQTRTLTTESFIISIPKDLYEESIMRSSVSINGGILTDNGEGDIITLSGHIGGQIFYSHGLIILNSFSTLQDISFSSSLTVYENQYKCTISENEFQYSQNPTLLTGSSNDKYYDFATGSFFTPYITTVGLYNDAGELLMTGKLSFPVPLSKQIDTSFIINFDK